MNSFCFKPTLIRLLLLSILVTLAPLVSMGDADATSQAEPVLGHKQVYEALYTLESKFKDAVQDEGADQVHFHRLASPLVDGLNNEAFCKSVGISAAQSKAYVDMLIEAGRYWHSDRIADPESKQAFVTGYLRAIRKLAGTNLTLQAEAIGSN